MVSLSQQSGSSMVATSDHSPARPSSAGTRLQGIFWILTVPLSLETVVRTIERSEDEGHRKRLGLAWLRGQREVGEGGLAHVQLCVAFATKVSLRGVRRVFGTAHAELSRSEAANDYVWKEDTRVEGSS